MESFDRYFYARKDGGLDQLPFITIPEHPDDKYIEYIEGLNKTRFDILAQKYYNNPTMGFIILIANPQYLSEHDIPDGTIIRIPFTRERILRLYNEKMKEIFDS